MSMKLTTEHYEV